VPTVVAGGPGQTGVQGYLRFLFAAAADPRFTAGTILGEIARNHELSLLDRLLYRFAIIPATRSALLSKRSAAAWMEARAEWGRGRTDGPNVFKIALLRRPDDSTTGTADMMPVWNLKAQGKRPYWWDGSNADITEVTRSSAIASGATLEWIDRDARTWSEDNRSTRSSLRRVQSFMENLAVPKYPLAIDRELASQGQAAFAVACAKCHAPRGGPAPVVPLDQAGTDQRRLEAWTDEAATALNAHYEGRKWKFVAFRKGEGYAPIPLDGVWLRAPYLHNGSVPTLRALLERPEQRPARFFRGYDVLDGENVGFIATGPDAERVGTLVDTSLPGNSNSGHLYGSDLPPHSKRALLEYLKTL
jgi:hypothetical protein